MSPQHSILLAMASFALSVLFTALLAMLSGLLLAARSGREGCLDHWYASELGWLRPESEARALKLLKDWLSPAQLSESVRRVQAGLQSFLSMRRIEARRKNASAFRLRFSQSLASLRQRLSQAIVRSTIQRFGKTTNPLT
jgi:hypothetical protein